MTEFIDLLTDHEETILTEWLGYRSYPKGFRQGNEISYSNDREYKRYHSWNEDYSSKKDYDAYSLTLSDFDRKTYSGDKEISDCLFLFMYGKFGDKWALKAIEYFAGNKDFTIKTQKHCVLFISTLMKMNQKEIYSIMMNHDWPTNHKGFSSLLARIKSESENQA